MWWGLMAKRGGTKTDAISHLSHATHATNAISHAINAISHATNAISHARMRYKLVRYNCLTVLKQSVGFFSVGLKVRPELFIHDICERIFCKHCFLVFAQKRNEKQDSFMTARRVSSRPWRNKSRNLPLYYSCRWLVQEARGNRCHTHSLRMGWRDICEFP